ncbi:carbonic anhydrase family protein [Nocardioides sp. C4-1]|uniref:carbonic anhydrase n=1 Tax=Nocardioides sp. C4-1 TaxID=3151851 RepID=UPI003267506D
MKISGMALTVALLSVVAAGCGQENDDDTAAETPPASSSGSSSAPGADGSPTEEPPPLTGTEVHWGYEGDIGPDRWGELSADYAECAQGVEQSPIDLHAGRPTASEPGQEIELDYGEIDDHLVNNGHAIQLVNDEVDSPDDDDLDDHLELDGVDYELLQFHFHAPSEHTVDGVASPVEFHFVHADADGNLAVLGVLVREGGSDNPAWAPFVTAASTPSSMDVPSTLDLAGLLPTSAGALEHWAYDGSLTTPPCSEQVTWLVLDHPVELSQAQVEALESVYVDNNRPVQPLGDRTVALVSN